MRGRPGRTYPGSTARAHPWDEPSYVEVSGATGSTVGGMANIIVFGAGGRAGRGAGGGGARRGGRGAGGGGGARRGEGVAAGGGPRGGRAPTRAGAPAPRPPRPPPRGPTPPG